MGEYSLLMIVVGDLFHMNDYCMGTILYGSSVEETTLHFCSQLVITIKLTEYQLLSLCHVEE